MQKSNTFWETHYNILFNHPTRYSINITLKSNFYINKEETISSLIHFRLTHKQIDIEIIDIYNKQYPCQLVAYEKYLNEYYIV